MFKKPIIKTNPYLKNSLQRQMLLYKSIASSTAIEGVHAAVAKAIKPLKKSTEHVVISESEESDVSQR